MVSTLTTTPAVLRWEMPPPAAVRPGERNPDDSPWAAIAAELQRHPDRWGVIFEGSSGSAGGLAHRVNHGTVPAFCPAGDFEAVSRRVRGGGTAVYARYRPDPLGGLEYPHDDESLPPDHNTLGLRVGTRWRTP